MPLLMNLELKMLNSPKLLYMTPHYLEYVAARLFEKMELFEKVEL